MKDENKREISIEELKKEIALNLKANERLNKEIQEIQDRKKAELALQQETRRKEIECKWNEVQKLIDNYIEDYGSIEFKTQDTRNGFCNPYWKALGCF